MTEKNQTEIYFEWWLDELVKEGFVYEYIREPQSFTLAPKLTVSYAKQLVTKSKECKHTLFNEITYTPDYKIIFTKKAVGLFVYVLEKAGDWLEPNFNSGCHLIGKLAGKIGNELLYNVYVDVKPPASVIRFSSKVSSSREFPIKQRLMFDEHNIYVNKVIPVGSPTCLFSKTFIPKRYLRTDKDKGERKLKANELKYCDLQTFLNNTTHNGRKRK